jgi:hypothetical protein
MKVDEGAHVVLGRDIFVLWVGRASTPPSPWTMGIMLDVLSDELLEPTSPV